MNEYRNIRSKEGYEGLLKTVFFWEFYPELSGNWDDDKKVIFMNNKSVTVSFNASFTTAGKTGQLKNKRSTIPYSQTINIGLQCEDLPHAVATALGNFVDKLTEQEIQQLNYIGDIRVGM